MRSVPKQQKNKSASMFSVQKNQTKTKHVNLYAFGIFFSSQGKKARTWPSSIALVSCTFVCKLQSKTFICSLFFFSAGLPHEGVLTARVAYMYIHTCQSEGVRMDYFPRVRVCMGSGHRSRPQAAAV